MIQQLILLGILLIQPILGSSQPAEELLPVNLNVGGRTISKLPFVIAKELNIYLKYGLDVDIRLPEPDFPGGVITERLFPNSSRRLDIRITGLAPNIMNQLTIAGTDKSKAIGSTDCHTRAIIVGKRDDVLPYDFKNKRIGVSSYHTTTNFVAHILAKRLNLNSVQDLSIINGGQTYMDIESNEVDAIVMTEVQGALAIKEGYNVLVDAREWNEPMAGNSIMVSEEWLQDEANYSKAINFLKATAESLAIIHNNKSLTLSILTKWYGINDSTLLELIYEEAKYMPKYPFVCVDGIENTLAVYDSFITKQHSPDEFYDDRFINELKEEGFFDTLYE